MEIDLRPYGGGIEKQAWLIREPAAGRSGKEGGG